MNYAQEFAWGTRSSLPWEFDNAHETELEVIPKFASNSSDMRIAPSEQSTDYDNSTSNFWK